MKFKTVEVNGHTYCEMQDDAVVILSDDGKEIKYTEGVITRLSGEAMGHRKRAETAEAAAREADARAKAFEGIEDAEAARKALETIKNIDEGKLIQAGKVEEIKAAAKRAAEEQVAAANKASTEALKRAELERDAIRSQYEGEKLAGAFKGSKFATEKLAIPTDFVQARFGTNFKIEEGRIVGYGPDGNKLFSHTRAGDLADFDEALEMLVDQYPHKDHILKGTGSRGDGARPSNGSGPPGQKKMTRAEFNSLTPPTQAGRMAEGFVVVD